MRYDVAADRWSASTFDATELVAEPGRNGQVVFLPSATGAPVELLDSQGNPVAELPAFPGDPGLFGDSVGASGWWVGDEAVFWIWTGEFPNAHEQMWTLNGGLRSYCSNFTRTPATPAPSLWSGKSRRHHLILWCIPAGVKLSSLDSVGWDVS